MVAGTQCLQFSMHFKYAGAHAILIPAISSQGQELFASPLHFFQNLAVKPVIFPDLLLLLLLSRFSRFQLCVTP